MTNNDFDYIPETEDGLLDLLANKLQAIPLLLDRDEIERAKKLVDISIEALIIRRTERAKEVDYES